MREGEGAVLSEFVLRDFHLSRADYKTKRCNELRRDSQLAFSVLFPFLSFSLHISERS